MIRWLPLPLALLSLLRPLEVRAHELRPGYLEIRESAPETYEVFWKVPVRGDTERLSLHVRFAGEVRELAPPVNAFIDGAHIQRMRIGREGGLDGATVTIDGLATTFTDVLLRFERADGTTLTRRLTPDSPGYTFEAQPGGSQVAWTYFALGVEHILLGIDHLLFVLGLLLIVDRRWMLVKTITAFTLAHSLTLALSTCTLLRVPSPPLNAAIALSILFLGPEIVRKWRGETSLTLRHPWVVAFVFGLVHGIGFASGLSLTGVPRVEVPAALLFFNLGVEAGQLAFVLVAIATAHSLLVLELDRPVWINRIPGYVVGSLGALWTLQRIVPIVLAL